MSINILMFSTATWLVLFLSQCDSQASSSLAQGPVIGQGPSYRNRGPAPSVVNWYTLPPYGSYGPYGGFCCFTININMPPAPGPGPPPPPPNNTIGPLAILPNGTMILPSGALRFPNATVVLTQYVPGAVPPAGRMPSGRIIFANNTILDAALVTSFPPPGFPLVAPLETTAYPPLILPNRTMILQTGMLAIHHARITTIFTRGFNPNCGGLVCHFFVPTGKR